MHSSKFLPENNFNLVQCNIFNLKQWTPDLDLIFSIEVRNCEDLSDKHLDFGACHLFVCACSVTQSWPTHCDPMDCTSPGSSVCGILKARILECVAITTSRGSSQPKDQIYISYVSYLVGSSLPPGKPYHLSTTILFLRICFPPPPSLSNQKSRNLYIILFRNWEKMVQKAKNRTETYFLK